MNVLPTNCIKISDLSDIPGAFYCKTCKILCNTKEQLQNHENGKRHLSLVMSGGNTYKLSDNNLPTAGSALVNKPKEADDNKCLDCGKYMDIGSLLTHVCDDFGDIFVYDPEKYAKPSSSYNEIQITESKPKSTTLIKSTEALSCSICEVTFNSQFQQEEHNKSKRHLKNVDLIVNNAETSTIVLKKSKKRKRRSKSVAVSNNDYHLTSLMTSEAFGGNAFQYMSTISGIGTALRADAFPSHSGLCRLVDNFQPHTVVQLLPQSFTNALHNSSTSILGIIASRLIVGCLLKSDDDKATTKSYSDSDDPEEYQVNGGKLMQTTKKHRLVVWLSNSSESVQKDYIILKDQLKSCYLNLQSEVADNAKSADDCRLPRLAVCLPDKVGLSDKNIPLFRHDVIITQPDCLKQMLDRKMLSECQLLGVLVFKVTEFPSSFNLLLSALVAQITDEASWSTKVILLCDKAYDHSQLMGDFQQLLL